MFCSECGAKSAEGATFCEECGARVERDPLSQSSPPVAPAVPRPATPHLIPVPVTAPATAALRRKPIAARGISLTGLGLCLVGLLMPWMQISCGGVRLDLEGHRLLLGTTLEKTRQFDQAISQLTGSRPSARQRSQPNVLLLVWIIFVVIGAVGVSSAPSKAGAFAGGLLCALIGAGALYGFWRDSSREIQSAMVQSLGLLHVNWTSGFWMAWAGTILVGVAAPLRLAESP